MIQRISPPLVVLLLVLASVLCLAQTTTTTSIVPDWAGNLLSENTNLVTLIPATDPIFTDPQSTQSATTQPPFLPRGSLYSLFGTAQNAVDPQNTFNDVISFDTQTGGSAGALRILGDHVQVVMLTDQIELKYFFRSRTCGGGSPRIQLAIDGDGDGAFKQFPGGPDQNAFGYLGDKPFGGECAMGMWVHEDMTDNVPKWDLSQWAPASAAFCVNPFTCTWPQVVAFFQTVFPNHRVLNAALIDDSAGFFVLGRGCVSFDLVNTGARTYTNRQDATGNGSAANTCP